MKRSTLIVAGVFVALLVAAVLVLSRKPERGISRISLAGVPKDRIDRVVLGGKDAVELKKDGTSWTLASGKQADGAAVGRLLDAIVAVKSSDLLTTDASRFAEYEVDDEKGTRVRALAGDEELAELVVGKALPGGLAVLVDGRVYRVSGVVRGQLVRAPSAWREHRLFTGSPEEATRVEVALAGAPAYALVKTDGVWGVEDPTVLPAGFRFDADGARALVSALVMLRAKEFDDTEPGAEVTGLAEGADTLVVHLAPKAEGAAPAGEAKAPSAEAKPAAAPVVRVVRLGKTKGETKDVYARVEGGEDVFTLHEATARSLRKQATDLRDLRLMSFAREKVRKLTIADGKVGLGLEKKDGAWQLVRSGEPAPAGFELDPAAVERRVTTILTARALRLAGARERTGLEAPAARATITFEDGTSATLAFGRELKEAEREAVFARGNVDGAAYVVPKWTRQSVTGGIATFAKQPDGGMPSLDPETLSSLPPEVRERLLEQMRQKQREQQLMRQLEAQQGTGGTPAGR